MRLTAWREWFGPSTPWDRVVFWALDLETTGLDPARDHIISAGMVPVRGGTIRIGECWHTHVCLPEGARSSLDALRVHHIMPRVSAGAPSLADVVRDVDRRLREGVLLVHFATLDVAFLREACRRTGQRWPRPPVVDTAALAWRLHQRATWPREPATEPDLGLADARAACGLPPHRAHDALADAVATAELFLVLRSRLDLRTLRQLV
jgi:DNA polymerase III subunit epsilon